MEPANDKPNGALREPDPMEAILSWWDFIRKPEHANAIIAIFTILIFLTGAFYTVFAGLQWHANKEAAGAAQSAAETARDALERGERPWVGPSGDVKLLSTPLIGKDGTVSFGAEVALKNFGKSPALNVEMQLEPDVGSDDSAERLGIQFVNDRCKADVSKGRDIIFPDSETTYTTSGSRYLPSLKASPFFTLEGCVLYEDQFQAKIHHTRFCFVVPYMNQFPAHQCGTTAD